MEAIYNVQEGKRLKNYYYAAVTDGTRWGVVGYDGIMHCGSPEMVAARFKTKQEARDAAEDCPDMEDYKIKRVSGN